MLYPPFVVYHCQTSYFSYYFPSQMWLDLCSCLVEKGVSGASSIYFLQLLIFSWLIKVMCAFKQLGVSGLFWGSLGGSLDRSLRGP